MGSENGLLVDVGEIRNLIEQADVFAVAFGQFPQRLLVDTRHDDRVSRLVEVVEPVASVQERFFWLGARRPSLGMPQSFMFFAWPHSVSFLEESGIWERLRQRTGADRDEGVARQCATALEMLRGLEKQAMAAAVTGANHATLWPRG